MTAYEMRISDWSSDVCSSDLFQGIQVLLKVVELGSWSGAARALDMSPTMATKHVAAIEQRLGVRLLHRTTRKVTPTEIGRTFVQNAERIIAELQEAEAEAAADKLVVRGLLRGNVRAEEDKSEQQSLMSI